MPEGLSIAVVAAYAYLVGSVPSAYLMARWAKGIDIRKYGSGNIGGANVAASVGKRYAIPVMLFDILAKGTASVLLARLLELGLGYQALAGLAAVAGHNWSLYVRLVGGRGNATALGVLLALTPQALLAGLAVVGVGMVLFRGTALWVGIGMALLPLWAWVLGDPVEVILFTIALVMLLALKRLDANRLKAPAGVPRHVVAVRRLLFDRDVSTREEWTRRHPQGGGNETQ